MRTRESSFYKQIEQMKRAAESCDLYDEPQEPESNQTPKRW